MGVIMKLLCAGCLFFSVLFSWYIDRYMHPPSVLIDRIEDLDESLIAWEKLGFYVKIYDINVFGIHLKAQGDNIRNVTCIVVHGFPSSSFEYSYGAAKGLQRLGYDVLLHDHVGFGFSDKPLAGFGYSIHDHADVALAFYDHMKMELQETSVFIGHDMGDSILTEMLSRYERNRAVFPSTLSLNKVIFTNGGMYMKEASLRLSQRLLSSRFAEGFSNLVGNVDKHSVVAKHQLKTVFASDIKMEPSTSVVGELTSHQIQLIQDILNFKGGNVILWRLSRYLQDRYACEERWIAAIKKLELAKVPFHFIWASDDGVAPLNIPKLFIEKSNLTESKLTVIEGKGHFWMMEKGDGAFWASTMHQAIEGN